MHIYCLTFIFRHFISFWHDSIHTFFLKYNKIIYIWFKGSWINVGQNIWNLIILVILSKSKRYKVFKADMRKCSIPCLICWARSLLYLSSSIISFRRLPLFVFVFTFGPYSYQKGFIRIIEYNFDFVFWDFWRVMRLWRSFLFYWQTCLHVFLKMNRGLKWNFVRMLALPYRCTLH